MADAEKGAWVTRVLGFTSGNVARAAEPTAAPVGLVAFAKLRLAWNGAKNAVAGDVSRLRGVVVEEFSDDPLIGSVTKLDGILDHFQAGLGDRLDDLANAESTAARAKAAKAAEAIAADYADYVSGDALIDLVETNPFVDVVISGRLNGPLSEIRKALNTLAG